ncbi:MAG TPA: hypothetical protein ACFYD3_10525 [Candidatus Hypogeohydataceae bacterium YC41]
MLRMSFPLLALLVILSFTRSANAANYEVVELSPTHLMIVPKQWALEEEKASKLTMVSYRDTFKEALLTLSARYKIKAITPIEGFAKKEEVMVNTGGSLTVGLILEVEKKEEKK